MTVAVLGSFGEVTVMAVSGEFGGCNGDLCFIL